MEFQKVTYERAMNFKVDGRAALALRREGCSLPQIKAALGTDASLATISRSIKRATEGKAS